MTENSGPNKKKQNNVFWTQTAKTLNNEGPVVLKYLVWQRVRFNILITIKYFF